MHHDGSQPAVEAEHFIQWLKESSLFAISLDDEGHWFRFHHLFKDFLQAMLRKKKSKAASKPSTGLPQVGLQIRGSLRRLLNIF
jgi:hypothetical protein